MNDYSSVIYEDDTLPVLRNFGSFRNKAKILAAEREFVTETARHCQFYFTLQTTCRIWDYSTSQIEEKRELLSEHVTTLQSRLYKKAVRHKRKRGNDDGFLFCAIIEGHSKLSCRKGTLHAHGAVAWPKLEIATENTLEKRKNTLKNNIENIWKKLEYGTSDVHVGLLWSSDGCDWLKNYLYKERDDGPFTGLEWQAAYTI